MMLRIKSDCAYICDKCGKRVNGLLDFYTDDENKEEYTICTQCYDIFFSGLENYKKSFFTSLRLQYAKNQKILEILESEYRAKVYDTFPVKEEA